MWIDIFRLILSLAIILLSCELFTNGIEWLGKRLKVGDGVVGSIFSAVGTCLPETTIPIIALLFSDGLSGSTDIGIGAIAGAPFMLSTLAFFVTGVSVLAFWKRRKTGLAMKVNNNILSRDIGFFIIVYSIGISVSFVRINAVRYLAAVFLLLCYIYYVFRTVKDDRESNSELENLYIVKLLKKRPNIGFILFQIILSLTGIILGAEMFVGSIKSVSDFIGLSPLVLSLIITPIATELPEKFNSVIWISKKKDTLALGNISGAMVFQSCIPVSIGILGTSWILDTKVIVSAILSVISSFTTFLWIKVKGELNPIPLLAGGLFYTIFILFLLTGGFNS
ncbi:MAG: sodium:calcium antiporter [Bacillota bacterium]|nr:sodium:calcium antiporter [Bacillota bacterium]